MSKFLACNVAVAGAFALALLVGGTAQAQYYQPHSHHGHYGGHSQHVGNHDFHHQHQHQQPVTVYRFGGFSHIDDLAQDLEADANRLCLELYYNYQHNPGFRETYREAYEILTTARYIHGLEHAGNRQKLTQVAAELDALFHHVEDDVVHWTGHQHRYVAPGGLRHKLANLGGTLHHLLEDMGVRSQFPAAPSLGAPQVGFGQPGH